MAMQKVKAVQDNDGHWFVIPEDMSGTFQVLLDECERFDDYTLFEMEFSEYMTGGDLNLIQLYAGI